MSRLVDLWRTKTDDEVIDAMKDLKGFLPEAQEVIRAEFKDRGLTYRKTYTEEKRTQRELAVRDTIEIAKKHIYPTQQVTVIRLTGVMCLVSVGLGYKSVVDPVLWTIEYGDAVSIALAVLGVVTALWALGAAYSAFKPSPIGWTTLTTFLAVSAGASLMSVLTMIIQLFGRPEVVGITYSILGIDMSWSGVAERILNGIVATGIWSAALISIYRPSSQRLMDVTEERRDKTTKLIKRMLIVVIALPIAWSLTRSIF